MLASPTTTMFYPEMSYLSLSIPYNQFLPLHTLKMRSLLIFMHFLKLRTGNILIIRKLAILCACVCSLYQALLFYMYAKVKVK